MPSLKLYEWHGWGHAHSAVSSSGLPSTGDISIYWGDSSGRPRGDLGTGASPLWEKAERDGTGDKKAQGALMYIPGGSM